MNPETAKKELEEKVIDLNDDFQMGQRAKEFAGTEYWQIKSGEFREAIKRYYDDQRDKSKEQYLTGIRTKDGIISGQALLIEDLKEEIYVQTIESVLNMVKMAVVRGDEAYGKLQKIKNK